VAVNLTVFVFAAALLLLGASHAAIDRCLLPAGLQWQTRRTLLQQSIDRTKGRAPHIDPTTHFASGVKSIVTN